MKPLARPDEESLGSVPAEAEPRARPPQTYRIAGDIEVRAKELEQELVQAKAKMRAMEREVFAARKVVRRRRGMRAASAGGIGALVGSLIGGMAYGVLDEPALLVAGTVVGFVLAALGAMRWEDPDDKFPDAPPPRLIG